jgi:type IV pilus assembly protein PilF
MKPLHTIVIAAALATLAACSTEPKKDPNEPSISEIYVRKGVQYMNSGMLDVALQDLKHAVELDKNNSGAHDALAVLYQRLNQPTDAEREFQQALSLDTANYGTANNYGRFLCEQGQYDKAMTQFQKVISSKLYASPWIALTNAGLCARSKGIRSDAESYLRKALESNPTFPPALMEMAKLSLESGQFMSARAFVQRYEEAAPADADILLLGIQVEQALGNEQGAADYRSKLRAQFPDEREGNRPISNFPSH